MVGKHFDRTPSRDALVLSWLIFYNKRIELLLLLVWLTKAFLL
jgi:hypothetical protein